MPASDCSSSGAATAGSGRRPSSSLTPAIVALGVALAIQFGVNMAQIAFGLVTDASYRPPYPIARMPLVQSDLRMIRQATHGYLAGGQDHDAVMQYARAHDTWMRRCTYPPIIPRLFAALDLLPGLGAHYFWLFAVPLCVTASIIITARLLVPASGTEARFVIGLTLLTLLVSTPLIFQTERGAFDWFVFALYLVALAGLSQGHSYGSGVLLGVATAVKLYPGFLLPWLLLSRRFKATLAALATMLAVVVVTGPRSNWQWLTGLGKDRALSFGAHPCNTGLANLLGMLGFSHSTHLPSLSYAIFLLLVIAFFTVAFVRHRRAPVDIGRVGLIAIPFMFLMPMTHWAYSLFGLVAVIPLLCALYPEREDLRPPLLAASAFIGITQAPFVALRSFPVGLSIVTPVYSACILSLSLLSIWLVARGGADAPRATPAVSV